MAITFMAVVVPGIEAGHKWSGADPILMIEGHQFNVRIEWPEEFDCEIDSIDVVVGVDKS